MEVPFEIFVYYGCNITNKRMPFKKIVGDSNENESKVTKKAISIHRFPIPWTIEIKRLKQTKIVGDASNVIFVTDSFLEKSYPSTRICSLKCLLLMPQNSTEVTT